MIVIGIDPGNARTGYGIITEDQYSKLKALDYGVINTEPDLPTEIRLLQIYKGLQQIIHTYRPDNAAVEKLFFQKNVRTAFAVCQSRGVALLAFAQASIPIAEYTPLEIKQAVAAYGKADKRQVQKMVQMLLDLEKIPQPDDVADALAVAICHLQNLKYHSLVPNIE